ncbi:MAG: cyclic nucleotide-binding domain-containing protein [Chloroflexi bacterium]|jgi:CRP/FNR family cyclic AMP-dependent transcriptional regulator|nr:cyclic nucleotide-binding domain-containing protein [Chloroflexota bacterium]
MSSGELGKVYADGELIVHEGEVGDCMYVIQEGQAEAFVGEGANEIRLNILDPGDFFGEMALFDRDDRSASVRALGAARVLTVDKKNFMRRVHEDPALAFRLVETMSLRIRNLLDKLSELESKQ